MIHPHFQTTILTANRRIFKVSFRPATRGVFYCPATTADTVQT